MTHYKTISEWFETWQLPKPEHPLISVISVDISRIIPAGETVTTICDIYFIALKRLQGSRDIRLKYGQQSYDFNEGIMSFVFRGRYPTFPPKRM